MESNSIELLHSIQLDMLVKFDKICEDNGLTYFLDSGTALGAVRHQGFIPWDDDVDVGMPREDYNKLLELGKKGLPDNLFVQTYKNDPAYMMPFAKVRLGNTYFPEQADYVEKLKYQGIYIDVFPFDKVPDNVQKAICVIKRSRFFYFLTVFSRRDYLGEKKIVQLFSNMLHRLPCKLLLWFNEIYDKYCIRYNKRKSHTWTCFCWRMSQGNTFLFDESELFPPKKIVFEGKPVNIMNDYHTYLSKMFGNYMELPSIEKRKVHLMGEFRI